MFSILLAALALTLASLAAVFATERAASRITGPLGWGLALALILLAVLALHGILLGAESLAAATLLLMAAIPAIATAIGWQRRKQG